MRVLVTGAEGYIGVLLTRTLVARGHDVVGLDAGFFSERNLYELGDADAVSTSIRQDVRRLDVDDLQAFDAVVHLAELSNDPLGELNTEITYRINHEGTVRLAKLCREAGVRRFVHSSSCSVYGAGLNGLVTEESAVNPQTSYAHCKVLAERDITKLASDTFSPTFLRNATVFGASPHMRFDLVLNNLAGHAWTGGEIRLTSDGSPWRPLVHVQDVCDAFAAVLDAAPEVVHNKTYNVGDSDQNYRVAEIAQIVAGAFPGCPVTTGAPSGDSRSYRVSFDRIANELPGFRCRRTAADGAAELARVFADVDLALSDFEGRHFTRLTQLKHLLSTGRLSADLFWVSKHQAA